MLFIKVKSKAFSTPLLLIALIVITGAVVVYRYKEPLVNQVHLSRTTPSPLKKEALKVAPLPTALPAATLTPSANLPSIASINPSPLPSAIVATKGTLPRSGPEAETAFLIVSSSLSSAGIYYFQLRRRLKKTWQELDIV